MDLVDLQNTCDGGGAGDAFASKNSSTQPTRFEEIKMFRLFCGFVNSKPEGRKTAIGIVNYDLLSDIVSYSVAYELNYLLRCD